MWACGALRTSNLLSLCPPLLLEKCIIVYITCHIRLDHRIRTRPHTRRGGCGHIRFKVFPSDGTKPATPPQKSMPAGIYARPAYMRSPHDNTKTGDQDHTPAAAGVWSCIASITSHSKAGKKHVRINTYHDTCKSPHASPSLHEYPPNEITNKVLLETTTRGGQTESIAPNPCNLHDERGSAAPHTRFGGHENPPNENTMKPRTKYRCAQRHQTLPECPIPEQPAHNPTMDETQHHTHAAADVWYIRPLCLKTCPNY
ncbi:hypothetical protein BS47DRAFT_1357310 [Hydnum rufescens UP504]|uniref:Uncharacterized protein n=1 Tax=Hydnum rufescens UP504 TaxID=1448309 RepID=A0A9P6E2L2_9AGAM|nr:hypothetical protein BS47DRAFT_1357310 [Hydnum rufescens UP504]